MKCGWMSCSCSAWCQVISSDPFWASNHSYLCTLTFWTSVTLLGSSFRLPEPDLGDFQSVSFGFCPGVLFPFSFRMMIMGITRKVAVIKMMVKIINIDVVPRNPFFSPLIGVTCCFLCAFWGALGAVTLDEQFPVVQLTCGSSTAGLHGFLCVCCWFNFTTCFSLSGRITHWAPFFTSYLLAFALWFRFAATSLQSGLI